MPFALIESEITEYEIVYFDGKYEYVSFPSRTFCLIALKLPSVVIPVTEICSLSISGVSLLFSLSQALVKTSSLNTS